MQHVLLLVNSVSFRCIVLATETLELVANDLTGTISADLCARIGGAFDEIKVLTTDCLGDPPPVVCECCTSCA